MTDEALKAAEKAQSEVLYLRGEVARLEEALATVRLRLSRLESRFDRLLTALEP